MLKLEIEDWNDAGDIACLEHRATWARLRVSVNDHIVSRLYDFKARSDRSSLYLSVYPLAEWIASRWFLLFFESEVPGRAEPREFRQRHVIRAAGDGFALPELAIVPEGQKIRLEWRALELSACGLQFLSSGEDRVDRDRLRESLAEFVETVIGRLEAEAPSRTTFLQEEWQRVRDLDVAEQEFCATAASLGLDPFCLGSTQEAEIIAVHGEVPTALRDDFFSAAVPSHLREHLTWLTEGLSKAASWSRSSDTLPSLRKFAASTFARVTPGSPWQEGYDCARRLREYLGLRSEPLDNRDYDEKLGYGSAQDLCNDYINFDALTVRNRNSDLGAFVLSSRLNPSKRFAYARALFEYLAHPATEALVSRAVTHRQRRNRAFAAELLAPAEDLRKRLGKGLTSQEQIEALANEFDVSTYVIQHQIENHMLGCVLTA